MNNQFRTHFLALALGSALAAAGQLALADADIGVASAGTGVEATTNVDLSVIVPEILIFGVGAVGTAVADISWTVDNAAGASTGDNQTYSGDVGAFTAPDPFDDEAVAAIDANGGTGSSATDNTATLPVFLFSNTGSDVTIEVTVTGSDGTDGGLDNTTTADTLDIADFTSGQTGSINHPDFAAGSGEDATTTATSGIVNLDGEWTYTYAPSGTLPVAGEYTGRLTYVASSP